MRGQRVLGVELQIVADRKPGDDGPQNSQPSRDSDSICEAGVEERRILKRSARQTCQRRQERHCEQRRDARDGVVDRGCHADVPSLRRAKHGRRQGRNRQRQTQPIHDDRRQDRGHVVGARADPRHQQHAAAGHQWPDGHRHTRPDPLRERASARRQEQHEQGGRQRGQTGLQW